MTKLIALIAILALSILSGLGNFYFTYGIWPKSWGSFVVFGVITVVLGQMLSAVLKEE